jgi:hypothetical protein
VGESRKERVDRELIELLNELRVLLPGTQVLFAFMLALPFMTLFERIPQTDRYVYYVAFICSAAGAALLMAPATNHRLRFREADKERLLFYFNRLIIAGSVFVAISIAAGVYVVSDALFSTSFSIVFGVAVLAWVAAFWFVVPLLRRRHRAQDMEPRD